MYIILKFYYFATEKSPHAIDIEQGDFLSLPIVAQRSPIRYKLELIQIYLEVINSKS